MTLLFFCSLAFSFSVDFLLYAHCSVPNRRCFIIVDLLLLVSRDVSNAPVSKKEKSFVEDFKNKHKPNLWAVCRIAGC